MFLRKMNENKTDTIATVIIAVLVTLVSIAMISYSEPSHNTAEYNTPYENFPDGYENSSFNPDNGYIRHTMTIWKD